MTDSHHTAALRLQVEALLQSHPQAAAQPANPDEATAQALAAVLDPTSRVLPGEVFQELARRNNALANAPRAEIVATISRQVVLLEAMAARLVQKAATATKPSAAAEFMRAALATERVLLQALGAVYQMNQNPAQAVEEISHADES